VQSTIDAHSITTIHKNSISNSIRRLGNHFSIALLNPTCTFFSIPSIDGIIGYCVNSQCAIVLGDPVCAPQDMPVLAQAFHNYAQKQFKNTIYIATSEDFVNFALYQTCNIALEIGQEIILDPSVNQKTRTGMKASQLRNKYNQSVRDGICVKEYTTYDALLEKAFEDVAKAWLKNRQGLQIYNLPINIFAGRTNKRWFYAEHNQKIVGVVILNRLDMHQGWVLNILMITPEAPNTTSEFIVLNVLETLRGEQCTFFSIGTLPATELGRVEGLGDYATWITRTLFNAPKKIFHLQDRQRYWKKFQPSIKPSFVLFEKSRIGFREIMGIMRTLNVNI
jgi:lysylphosphatidylglycerol synthetase-like protein (DUF2156 family)